MPLPKPRKDVPRARVGKIVQAMLTNPGVGDVECREEDDGTYHVVPLPTEDAEDDED